jgi:hypothetical protein
MAFDLYGINPRRSHSSCVRFSIWKWNDLRLILREGGMFENFNEQKFMSNDGHVVDGDNFFIFKAILLDTNEKFDRSISLNNSYFSDIYEKFNLAGLTPYQEDMGSSGGYRFGHIDLKLMILFTSDCDGFSIK